MIKTLTARKLFLAFSVLGIINIVLAYLFFYFSSVSLLEARSSQQMASVRILASQKLNLYLENLKINSVQKSSEVVKSPSLYENVIVFGIDEDRYAQLQPLQFTSHNSELILLKVPVGDKYVVWTFTHDGLNQVLSEHTGLGKTGEIYLVGFDEQIKSTPRHVTEWKNIRLNNESVKLAKQAKHGVHSVMDYRNVEVLSAYSPFTFDHLNFVLLSEIDKDEVFKPLKELFPKVFLICALLCWLTIIMAYLSSEKILKLIKEMREEINRLHIQFITTMESENRKISFNLHDGVGQILTALKWGISRNEDPEKLKALCDDVFKEIRSVSSDLMPAELSQLGFYPAVRNFIRKQEAYYNIAIHFWHNERIENYKFITGLDVNLYRMIQELIQNTLKHAKATSATLVMFREDDNLILRYEDDGIGMDEGHGMPKVISYRADLMGATLTRQKTQKGLVFQISIPLKRVFLETV